MRTLVRSFVAATLLAGSAHAAAAGGDYLSVYGGQFEVFDNSGDSALVGAEYRFKDQYNGLRPVVGGFVNGDSAAYGYAGAYWDLPLGTAPFVVSPGFAVGAYHSGASKDLGYGLEFRSTLEVDYQFENNHRLGLALSHLSNAGLGDKNPGVETAQVVYSYPLW